MIMTGKNQVQLLLGGNIGDRVKYLKTAKSQISRKVGSVLYKSAIYESEPWGFDDEREFLNQLIIVETTLSPTHLLAELKSIEIGMGRTKNKLQWSSRIIDIDILFYEHSIVEAKNLIIPHPSIAERRFVLEPLLESDPEFIHPLSNKSIKDLYEACSDQSGVVIYTES